MYIGVWQEYKLGRLVQSKSHPYLHCSSKAAFESMGWQSSAQVRLDTMYRQAAHIHRNRSVAVWRNLDPAWRMKESSSTGMLRSTFSRAQQRKSQIASLQRMYGLHAENDPKRQVRSPTVRSSLSLPDLAEGAQALTFGSNAKATTHISKKEITSEDARFYLRNVQVVEDFQDDFEDAVEDHAGALSFSESIGAELIAWSSNLQLDAVVSPAESPRFSLKS